MSLHTAAKYLKSHGRGPDDQLVHMSSKELKGLQALALAHGGSLSINPHTGLPEAGFLDNILPVIAGAALTPFLGPMGAALATGGFETVRTGDLGKGLMAGLGAYGGAGLGETLSTAGGEALSGAAQTSAITNPTAGATSAYQQAMESGATGDVAQKAFMDASNVQQPNYGQKLFEGAKNVFSSPTSAMNFAGDNYGKIGAAVAPTLMDALSPKQNMPGAPEEDPRYKGSPYRYNLAKNFTGATPVQPNPYYRPTGLGYAAGGDVMMYAGGSFDDEPRGDDQGFGYAAGGQLGGYSDGGRMLKGPGDGMSDSIPAVIGKRQPARLADGEFVVPADVVSHLGNGSTDAGAKRLYGMMDKIRKARTGKKKQAPAVKADKYLPV